jgi:Zn-dependent M28 family amino/carboxypeptidase
MRSFLVACCLLIPAVQAQDPVISAIASEVSRPNVTSTIRTLENFGTRYSYTASCDVAADWIYAKLEGYGLEVSFEEFEYGGKTMRNVIGRWPGILNPDRVFIIGAHYDSTSQTPWTLAPGADDNASGVAAVLEAARILQGYQFEDTIEFVLFGGEEQGRRGSQFNAAEAAAIGKTVVGMINIDMIGYWPASSDMEMDIGKNTLSSWLAAVAEDAAVTYASLPVHNWPDTGVCFDDQVSYWDEDIDGIVLMNCYEAHANPGGSGESTPHYHRTSDTSATLDLAQTTEAVRAAVAAMAMLATPAATPITLHVYQIPGSLDLRISWDGASPPYVLRTSLTRDFTSGVSELTPPGGTTDTEHFHEGVLADGVTYYYRVNTY